MPKQVWLELLYALRECMAKEAGLGELREAIHSFTACQDME